MLLLATPPKQHRFMLVPLCIRYLKSVQLEPAKSVWTRVLCVPAHINPNSLLFSLFISVVRGSIESVVEDGDDEQQASVLVSVSRLYRQKRRVFEGRGRSRWSGRVRVPRRCAIQVEQGSDSGVGQWAGLEEFLFTGAVRFGEARLGCALQYRDFLLMYQAAVESGRNPCHMDVNWEHRRDHVYNQFCCQWKTRSKFMIFGSYKDEAGGGCNERHAVCCFWLFRDDMKDQKTQNLRLCVYYQSFSAEHCVTSQLDTVKTYIVLQYSFSVSHQGTKYPLFSLKFRYWPPAVIMINTSACEVKWTIARQNFQNVSKRINLWIFMQY